MKRNHDLSEISKNRLKKNSIVKYRNIFQIVITFLL